MNISTINDILADWNTGTVKVKDISTLTDGEKSVMLDKVLELAIEAGMVEVEK